MKIRSHIRHHVPDNRIHVHNGENRDGENAFAPLLIFNLGFSLHYVFLDFQVCAHAYFSKFFGTNALQLEIGNTSCASGQMISSYKKHEEELHLRPHCDCLKKSILQILDYLRLL